MDCSRLPSVLMCSDQPHPLACCPKLALPAPAPHPLVVQVAHDKAHDVVQPQAQHGSVVQHLWLAAVHGVHLREGR